MKVNIKSSTVIKSMALAGALSIGVLIGGHNSEAAGFSKHDNHHVKREAAISLHEKGFAHHAKVKAKVDVDVVKIDKPKKHHHAEHPKAMKERSEKPLVKENKSIANKIHSQAAEHASEMAKLHAAANSAVHAVEQAKSGQGAQQDSPTDNTVMETAKHHRDADKAQKTKEVESKTKHKENKSHANKIHSQAAEHASENAKLHAAPNSAVLATDEEMDHSSEVSEDQKTDSKSEDKNSNDDKTVVSDENVKGVVSEDKDDEQSDLVSEDKEDSDHTGVVSKDKDDKQTGVVSEDKDDEQSGVVSEDKNDEQSRIVDEDNDDAERAGVVYEDKNDSDQAGVVSDDNDEATDNKTLTNIEDKDFVSENQDSTEE
ncbi:hypothetical protein AN964_22170 [Heyndrickxia shackletonii]|uniref:Uncharacterized protein n=1 Tax=Heyndrickxia shackletonii TaxID=157838 RepID=A0A0Q3TA28_9BACI|nr:hypothetical protein [Heyndrickxia shackletonii]KQL50377.1 hypothetical protein AN964_22170 [Heyndrickxia shackletonii]NEZ00834.1 hypothetical protein [Heyndrickxia shackletonii]